jgi:hypothetical protein
MYFQAINRFAPISAQQAQTAQLRFSGQGTPVRVENVSQAADKLQFLLNDKRNEAAESYQKTIDAEGQRTYEKLVEQGTPEGQARFIADIGPNSVFNGIRMKKFFEEEFNHFDSLRQVVRELEAKADKSPAEQEAVTLGKFILANETAHYIDVDPVTNRPTDGSNPDITYNHFVFRNEIEYQGSPKVKSPHVNFHDLTSSIAKNNRLDPEIIEAYNRSTNATLKATLES